MGKYDALFQPMKIRNMEVKNRIVMSPIAPGAGRFDGSLEDAAIDYYAERARGGAGMIILGGMSIGEKLDPANYHGTLASSHVIPQLGVLCDVLHMYDTKAVVQLTSGGGRNSLPSWFDDGQPYSASATPCLLDPSVMCRPMTVEEIHEMMDRFTNAASIAQRAGFDAIEVNAHGSCLIDQFMSPLWNHRTDEYGGSLENRMRYPREIIAAIRKGAGEDMPIIFRLSMEHDIEGGRTKEETLGILKELEAAGVDAIDLDGGSSENKERVIPSNYVGDAVTRALAEYGRQAISVPILNSCNHTPDSAVEMIEAGKVDFAMFGRSLIADPELPNKLLEGREDEIKPCLRCNEGCYGNALVLGKRIACSVNTRAGMEKRWEITKDGTQKKVVVIGGGPAGLEAAVVAAKRGHQVSVYEKAGILGGQIAAAGTPSFKKPLRDLIKYYERQLELLGVKLFLNTKVTGDEAFLAECDQIIVATGAVAIRPQIDGLDSSKVVEVVDAHLNPASVKGDRIVVCGGGLSGCDCALELAMDKGKKVTIIEMRGQLAADMGTNGFIFYDSINKQSLLRLLKENNVDTVLNGTVVEINDQGVVYEQDGKRVTVEADTVISAFGMKPDQALAKALTEAYPKKTRVIGDSVKTAKVGEAIRSGFYAGMAL